MKYLRRIRKQKGIVGIAFVMAMASMALAMLGGAQLLYISTVKARTTDALDIASLAAGAYIKSIVGSATALTPAQQTAMYNYAQGYLKANIPGNYISSGAVVLNSLAVSASYSASTNTWTVNTSVSGSMNTWTGGSWFGKITNISASNQVQLTLANNLELVLVLDNTGSMADAADSSNSTSKISALKTDAIAMINDLTSNSASGSSVYIGLVPFTTTVNVRDAAGTVPTRWLQSMKDAVVNTLPATAPYPSTGSSTWQGCIAEPHPNNGQLNKPPQTLDPSTSPFHAYFDSWNTNSNSPNITGPTISNTPGSLRNTTSTTSGPTTTYTYTYKYTYSYTYLYSNIYGYSNFNASYSNNCPQATTQFLTSNTTTLTSAINSMVASGSTFIASGIMWGWRMLDHTWAGSAGWGSSPTAPSGQPALPQAASNTLTKAIIIVTDGENTISTFNMFSIADISQAMLQSNGSYGTPPVSATATATAKAKETNTTGITPTSPPTAPDAPSSPGAPSTPSTTDVLGAYNNSGYANSLQPFGGYTTTTQDTIEIAACSAAKAAGIQIYAIALGDAKDDSQMAPAFALLQQCVNNQDQAYEAPTTAQLAIDVSSIEGQLSTLRLTK